MSKHTQDNVIVSKLGKTRAGERSRIWLEGKRLAAHGFAKGAPFAVTQHEDGRPVWRIWVMPAVINPGTVAVKRGTVAGTADRPIIDTVGALVASTFGTKGPTVRCEFHQGLIIIEAIPAPLPGRRAHILLLDDIDAEGTK